MKTLIARILIITAVGYAIVVALAWTFQERLAFPGVGGALPEPGLFGITNAEVTGFPSHDSTIITAWYLHPDPPPDSGGAPGLLWFHGNRENIADIASTLRQLRPAGTGVFIIDYRGYGQTPGRTTEENAYADAEAAWDALAARPEIDPDRIALYGRSIGGAVVLQLATRRSAVGVVLDSPFSSARDMARRHYPFLPTGLARLQLDNVQNARLLEVPLLVFHGADDYIAPLQMGRAVAAAGRGDLIVFPNAGHNDTYTVDPGTYRARLHEALRLVFER